MGNYNSLMKKNSSTRFRKLLVIDAGYNTDQVTQNNNQIHKINQITQNKSPKLILISCQSL